MILNNLKAISETDEELVVANYIILFGGRDLEWIKKGKGTNPDGSKGEFFTKSTVVESPYTNSGRLYVDWEHGFGEHLDGPESPDRDDVLGYVNWKSVRQDERGLWVERVLLRRNKYVRFLKELIDAGLLGTSSEPVQKSVQIGRDGEIKSWPLKRDTLTVMPADPRMLSENVVVALKSLADKLEIPAVEPDVTTLADRVAEVGKALTDVVNDTKGLLDSIDRPLSTKKREELTKLLELCSGLDDVRTELKTVLTVPIPVPDVGAKRLYHDLSQSRKRLARVLGD